MKILFTSPDLSVGGGVTSYSASLLSASRDQVQMFTVGSRAGAAGLHRRVGRLLLDYLNFCRVLRSRTFDLIHLNPSLAPFALIRDAIFLLLAKGYNNKVVVFIHGWDVACEEWINRHVPGLFRKIFDRADAFIVLAAEFRQKLTGMGITGPIHVETTIVDDEVFEFAIPDRPVSRCNLLFLSRIEKSKGIYEALEAYRIVKQRHPHVTMTIAGDGSELAAVKVHTARHNLADVAFIGFVRGTAKRQAYLDADLYLFPTHGEGMPTTVLEAMAYELPVITRGVGGLNDFFVDGEMGYITNSRNPIVFADCVEKLIDDPIKRAGMSKFNRDYARDHFAASKVAARISQIYLATAGGASGTDHG